MPRHLLAFALVVWLGGTTAFALDPNRSLFQYTLANWTRSSGLPGNRVNAITQSRDGYIWLGMQSGLVRFDGQVFHTVSPEFVGANGKEVRKVVASAAGGVYLMINHGGAASFDGRSFRPLADGRWPTGITGKAIIQTADGAVWMAWNYGFSRKGPGPVSIFHPQPGRVFALHERKKGGVWVGTEARGLFYAHDGAVKEINPELRPETVVTLAEDAQGRVWIGSGTGLRRYDETGRRYETPAIRESVNALYFDRYGVLWVGTAGAGLVRIHGGEQTRLRHADGLAGDSVTALHEDSEGNLWVGTTEGLSKLSDVKFPTYTHHEGLSAGAGHRIALSQRGGLWYTSRMGFSYFDGRKATLYPAQELTGDPYINLVHESRQGRLHVTGADQKLFIFSDPGRSIVHRLAGWPSALGEDDRGVLVAIDGWLFRLQAEGLVPYQLASGPIPDLGFIANLCTTADGSLWLGTYRGLMRIRNGELRQWSLEQGMKDERVEDIVPDGPDSVWAGTRRGIVHVQGDQLHDFTGAPGLPEAKIFAIVPDLAGSLWVDTTAGIWRLRVSSLARQRTMPTAEILVETYSGIDAAKNLDHATDQRYAGRRTADGRVWFTNSAGLLMIDPARIGKNERPPTIHIERVRVNDAEVPVGGPARFAVGAERIEFTFAVLSFVAPEQVRVRYRLDGLETAWIDAGKRRVAAYNLRPGSYRFLVHAANEDGVWTSQATEFSFEVPPPFYQTKPFFAAVAFAALFGLVGAHTLYTRQLRQRQEWLERTVSERTTELAHERDLLQTMLSSAPDPIFFKDAALRITRCSTAMAELLGARSANELVGRTEGEFLQSEAATVARQEEEQIMRTGVPVVGKAERITFRDGRERWVLSSKLPLYDKTGAVIGTFGISKDITRLKEAEARLLEARQQLVESSRQAGMAEVATAVLHNVGNVLNSVNVSTALLKQMVRDSKSASVGRIAALLKEHAGDLASYLTEDRRGRLVPEFLTALGDHLEVEKRELAAEIDSLTSSVDHIKEIVTLQQGIARYAGVLEPVPAVTMVEDALRMNGADAERQGVTLVRDFQANPTLMVDRHKVLQILVNLIRNAKQACDDSGQPKKEIRLRTSVEGSVARFSVQDNGVGIAAENLDRVFALGFTTRKQGHGFGLHSSALAANELGGTLRVESAGLGQGAAFHLELPLDREAG